MPSSPHLLILSTRTLFTATLAIVLCTLIAYPFAPHFGLAIQVVAHLGIVVAAGFFKLGYVMRLAAQHEAEEATRVLRPA